MTLLIRPLSPSEPSQAPQPPTVGSMWKKPSPETRCACVKGSKFSGQSPRVFPIPLFDPQYYTEGKLNGRVADFKLTNFLGFYADHIDNNGKIYGIITNIMGLVDKTATNVPSTMFAHAIRLVQ